MPKPPPNILKLPPPRFFTAWSFSRYKDWMECPRRARLRHLDKLAVAEAKRSPALIRGEEIHLAAEKFLRGTARKLHAALAGFADEFKALKKAKATPEGKWGFTLRWEPCAFDDWDRCWLRVVLDAHYRASKTKAKVIDYKTGRIYGDNADQLELYALGGFAHYPEVEEIDTELWYLDQGLILPEKGGTFRRPQVVKLQRKWRERAAPMLLDRKFVPRPGEHCARCDYAARRGGPCEFGR